MNDYRITVILNVKADSEQQALIRAYEQIDVGQFTPSVKLMADETVTGAALGCLIPND